MANKKKKKVKHVIQHGELDHVLEVCRSEAEAGDAWALSGLVDRIGEEADAILTARFGSRKPLNTLERAASDVRRFVVEWGLQAWRQEKLSPVQLAAEWEKSAPLLEAVLLRFLAERDMPEAERIRAARWEGGKTAGQTRREEAERQHDAIRKKAAELTREGTDARELAGLLARLYELSARQIRTILKKTPDDEKKRK